MKRDEQRGVTTERNTGSALMLARKRLRVCSRVVGGEYVKFVSELEMPTGTTPDEYASRLQKCVASRKWPKFYASTNVDGERCVFEEHWVSRD